MADRTTITAASPTDDCLVSRAAPAMGTIFETLLRGDDAEHLAAVADAMLDEARRLEARLSRFIPSSELSRVNREARDRDVLVDLEMAELLEQAFAAWRRTEGRFDITATSVATAGQVTLADVDWNPTARTIRFLRPDVQLDFGGIAKGYALDRAAELLAIYRVDHALLHAGTSSIVARGLAAPGQPWRVDVPCRGGVRAVELRDIAVATSTVSHDGEPSDIRDPHTGQRIVGEQGVTVLARSATEAETLSTALLCLGEKTATALLATWPDRPPVYWHAAAEHRGTPA